MLPRRAHGRGAAAARRATGTVAPLAALAAALLVLMLAGAARAAAAPPSRARRQLLASGLAKGPCTSTRTRGCKACWRYLDELPEVCAECDKGYIFNYETQVCDCARNYFSRCSTGADPVCFCERCPRGEEAEGGPFEKELSCTPKEKPDGVRRSLGVTVELDRPCSDIIAEDVRQGVEDAINDNYGGEVTLDELVTYLSSCKSVPKGADGKLWGVYKTRTEFQTERGGGAKRRAARQAAAARRDEGEPSAAARVSDVAAAAGGGDAPRGSAAERRAARKAARRAEREPSVKDATPAAADGEAARGSAAERRAAREAAAAAARRAEREPREPSGAFRMKDVTTALADADICAEALAELHDGGCAVKAGGGGGKPEVPVFDASWAVAVPLRAAAAAGGGCPPRDALAALGREVGASVAAAVRAMPGVKSASAAFLRCAALAGAGGAEGPLVELWFNVKESHAFGADPAATAAAASAGGGDGLCADGGAPFLCKLERRAVGALGSAALAPLRCVHGAGRRSDPASDDVNFGDETTETTFLGGFADATSDFAASEFFDPRLLVPMALVAASGGGAAAVDGSVDAAALGLRAGGAPGGVLKLTAEGVGGRYGKDSVKLIGTMRDGPVGPEFRGATCRGYDARTPEDASRWLTMGRLIELDGVFLSAGSPDTPPIPKPQNITGNSSSGGNSTGNSTGGDPSVLDFLEVSLYVTNVPLGQPVTKRDVIELAWQTGESQGDGYDGVETNLFEQSWYQRRYVERSQNIVELNALPLLNDASERDGFPTLDEYQRGGGYFARIFNADGDASYTLRSARLGNTTRILAAGVGIAAAAPPAIEYNGDSELRPPALAMPVANSGPHTYYVGGLRLTFTKIIDAPPGGGEDYEEGGLEGGTYSLPIEFVALGG
ncbi:MAG: hypothetical protein J3K34DRAFT_519203 [Monoraphidium minutum]|nr:MAG: hypothetical protein J3K34DRAFT_519203 [Monoraphidium minutum]